jgi:hypothetical protein
MSPDLAFAATGASARIQIVDRRLHHRYPIEVEVRYRLSDRHGIVAQGKGITHNLSTGGICFFGSQSSAKGFEAELSMDWPLRSPGASPLQLKVTGKVVRAGAGGVAVQITRYEFCSRTKAE